ncbi:MAG: hypothetical protein Q8O55_09145 [Dehalococcoidales bacterium]|nr:hypothetical protein [Dehalococcoidales bacterium]
MSNVSTTIATKNDDRQAALTWLRGGAYLRYGSMPVVVSAEKEGYPPCKQDSRLVNGKLC